MEICKGHIVRSTAGRDKDKLFIVLSIEENYVFLADGKLRRVEKPKRKKLKHIALFTKLDKTIDTVSVLKCGDLSQKGAPTAISNSEIRKLLAEVKSNKEVNLLG